MKFNVSTLALLTVAVIVTTATAFTIGPQKNAPSRSTTVQSKVSRPSTKLSLSPEDFAKSEIKSNDVVVFSKSYCPYCTATKELLTSMGVKYTVHELDKIGDDGPEIQSALLKMTGQRTVPSVFVKGQHIGGNDDTQAAARQGKLQEMLGLTK